MNAQGHVMSPIHAYERFVRHCSPGAAYGVALSAMASYFSASTAGCLKDWSGEVTHPAFLQRMITIPGNAAICALPIDAVTHELAVMLADKTHVGISAPPSSGKTELVVMWTLAFFHFNGNVTWSLAPLTDSHDGHVFYQCRYCVESGMCFR
jgi:hypothetical protein